MTFDFVFDPFADIRKLKNDIQELQNWRNQIADPNMQSNINNIIKIDANLTQNIVPAIQQAQQEISVDKLLIQENVIKVNNAVDLANNAVGDVTTMRDQVSMFAADINIAKTEALNAVNQVKDMSNRFIDAADGVVADMDNLKTASETFITVLKRETSAISAQFNQFGININANSEVIKVALDGLAKEFNEMISQTGKPLGDINEYLRRMREDDLVFIPFNAGMSISLLVSRHMVRFMQTFAGAPENPTLYDWYGRSSHGAVMEEIFEGFTELIVEFGKLGSSFVQFGNVIQEDANELQLRIERSMKTIELAFNDFVNAFNVVFVNLSKRLKGEAV